jgi:hypothetical protein
LQQRENASTHFLMREISHRRRTEGERRRGGREEKKETFVTSVPLEKKNQIHTRFSLPPPHSNNRRFESQLKEYDGDDPLEVWLRYESGEREIKKWKAHGLAIDC